MLRATLNKKIQNEGRMELHYAKTEPKVIDVRWMDMFFPVGHLWDQRVRTGTIGIPTCQTVCSCSLI